jgi:hypothetical protein
LLRSTQALASRFDGGSNCQQICNLGNTDMNGLHLGEQIADFDKFLVQPVEHKNQAAGNEYR